MKMCKINCFSLFCKSYLVLFLKFFIGTPILCCTTTDLGIFMFLFGAVLGIFGLAFVRALVKMCLQPEVGMLVIVQGTQRWSQIHEILSDKLKK